MSIGTTIEKQFQWYAPSIKKSNYKLNDDGTLTIEGIASTTNKDLQGDIVLPTAIESMKQQLTSTTKNLHGDHKYNLFDGVIGAIKEVLDTDENALKIKATIRSKFAQEIKEMLDIGINLGLSIGGRIKDYNPIKEGGWEIKDINLLEISLTAMPANWDTFGTITTSKDIVKAKCLTGACQIIRKNMEKNNMPNQEGNTNPETLTEEKVKDLFNELMAAEKEEIKSEVLDAVKQDMEKLVNDKVEELMSNEPTPAPGNDGNEGGMGEKSLEELFKEFTDSQNENLEKAVEEIINKYVKNPKSRNPSPTPNPDKTKNNSGNEGGEVKKSFTNKEIFKQIQENKKSNSIFNKLGANMED